MKKIIAAFLVFSSIGLSVIALGVGGSAATRPNANADAFNQGPDVDRLSAIVQLKGDPLTIHSATKPVAGKKIDFKNNAVQSYRAQLAAGRNEFRRWLRANAPRARVTSEYDVSLNAVAVELNGTPLETIAAAPMVARAEYNARRQIRCRGRNQNWRHRHRDRRNASFLRPDWVQLSHGIPQVLRSR